jgi:hypothetical protein
MRPTAIAWKQKIGNYLAYKIYLTKNLQPYQKVYTHSSNYYYLGAKFIEQKKIHALLGMNKIYMRLQLSDLLDEMIYNKRVFIIIVNMIIILSIFFYINLRVRGSSINDGIWKLLAVCLFGGSLHGKFDCFFIPKYQGNYRNLTPLWKTGAITYVALEMWNFSIKTYLKTFP